MCLALRDEHKRSKRNTDSTDATDFIFSRIFIWHNGFLCAIGAWIFTDFPFALGNPAPIGAMKSVTNPKHKWNPWKDKIRCIGVIRVRFWTWAKEPVGSWALGKHDVIILPSCAHRIRDEHKRSKKADITDIVREGTVFQTAVPLCVIVPRLRPGLLSLRSVLPSRQSLFSCLFGKVLFVFDITWGDKASKEKNLGKMDNDIFVVFIHWCFLLISLSGRQYQAYLLGIHKKIFLM